MTSVLETALELVPDLYAEHRVTRVERDPRGSVVVSLALGNEQLWLRQESDRLERCDPHRDPTLPLGATVTEGTEADCEVLAYRPGRRLVIRRCRKDLCVIHKGYRKKRWLSSELRHRVALIRAPDPSRDFRVPAILSSGPEASSFELELLRGESLEINSDASERFFAVGTALRRFQHGSADARLGRFGPFDELDVVGTWAERSRELCGWVPEGWPEIERALAASAATLPRASFGLSHRDLHDGQLLDLGDSIGLLDFDLLTWADQCLDVANLLAHLTLRVLQGREGTSEAGALACGSALLDGLDRARQPGFWERLRFYETTTFFRLAFVYALRPCWEGLPSQLVRYGRRCLEEVAQ